MTTQNNIELETAFNAEIDGFFMDAHKTDELLTVEDWTDFLHARLNDIVEVHELEEGEEEIFNYFVTRFNEEA